MTASATSPQEAQHASLVRRSLDLLDKLLIAAIGTLLVAVTATVLVQVAMRYLFNAPTSWSEELATVLFVWFVMLAIPPALRHHQHIRIEMLGEIPVKGLKSGLHIFGSIVFAVVFAVLGYYALQIMPSAARQLLTGLSGATGLHISMSAIYWAVPVGSALAVIFAIEQIFTPAPQTSHAE